MSSRPPPGPDHRGGDAGDAPLSRDIATPYRALSLDHRSSFPGEQQRHKPRLKPTSSSSFRKLLPSIAASSSSASTTSSSSSFWKTAKSYLGRRRLDCAFTLHVHSVDGLPASLDGSPMSVQFRRMPASASARPVAAALGAAAFEEALTLRSPVYFTRGAKANVKYEPRAFIVSVFASALDLGKHEVDLTRLLPLSFHDLEEGGDSGFGKWSTSFRLSTPARGARLNVTFSCALVGGGGGEQHKGREAVCLRHGSVARPVSALDCEDEGSPEAKHCTSVEVKKGDLVHPEDDRDSAEFNIVEYGVEVATDDPERFKHVGPSIVADHAVQMKFEELFCNDENVAEDQAVELKTDEGVVHVAVQLENVPTAAPEAEDQLLADKELEDLESMLSNLSFVGQEEFDSPTVEDKLSRRLSCTGEPDSSKSASRKGRSRSVDSEFLDMLGIEHSPFGQPSDSDSESPRERLWKQFEKEALASGNAILGLDFDDEMGERICEDVVEDFDLSAIMHEAEVELQNASQPMIPDFKLNCWKMKKLYL